MFDLIQKHQDFYFLPYFLYYVPSYLLQLLWVHFSLFHHETYIAVFYFWINHIFANLVNNRDFSVKPDYNISGESLLMEEVKLHNLIFNYVSFRACSHHHPLLNTKILDKELL